MSALQLCDSVAYRLPELWQLITDRLDIGGFDLADYAPDLGELLNLGVDFSPTSSDDITALIARLQAQFPDWDFRLPRIIRANSTIRIRMGGNPWPYTGSYADEVFSPVRCQLQGYDIIGDRRGRGGGQLVDSGPKVLRPAQ